MSEAQPTAERRPAELRTDAGEAVPCELTMYAFSRAQAFQRGLIAGGICMGLAVVILPIPLVHFAAIFIVLVMAPAATFGVYRVYSNSRVWRSEAAKCPHCGAVGAVRVAQVYYPTDQTCATCQTEFKVYVLA